MVHASMVRDTDLLAKNACGALYEAMCQIAHPARRFVAHRHITFRGFAKVEERTLGAGVELTDFRVDDVVDAQNEAAR